MAQMTSTETPRNGTSHHVGRMKRSASANAVPKSVTKVEAMMSWPIGVRRCGMLVGEEGREDAAARRGEVHPRRARPAGEVPGDDAQADLDQRDRDAELDGGHARQEDEQPRDHGDQEVFHPPPIKNPYRCLPGRGHQPREPRGGFGRTPSPFVISPIILPARPRSRFSISWPPGIISTTTSGKPGIRGARTYERLSSGSVRCDP